MRLVIFTSLKACITAVTAVTQALYYTVVVKKRAKLIDEVLRLAVNLRRNLQHISILPSPPTERRTLERLHTVSVLG